MFISFYHSGGWKDQDQDASNFCGKPHLIFIFQMVKRKSFGFCSSYKASNPILRTQLSLFYLKLMTIHLQQPYLK
jgi:hypothetical protein